ncbi:MAG: PilZ domain-containing protein [Candidatus Omnitrophica bacterium]|nr:PilZ domain-containing protein [Candidatus Omnitrophota bacterium]
MIAPLFIPKEEESSPAERRRFPRAKAGLEVEFRRLSEPGQRLLGSLSRDLSAGGIQLTANRFLPCDSRLVLFFRPRPLGRQIRAVARVQWVRERTAGDFFDCGLEFVEIAPEDKDAVAGLVERGTVLS